MAGGGKQQEPCKQRLLCTAEGAELRIAVSVAEGLRCRAHQRHAECRHGGKKRGERCRIAERQPQGNLCRVFAVRQRISLTAKKREARDHTALVRDLADARDEQIILGHHAERGGEKAVPTVLQRQNAIGAVAADDRIAGIGFCQLLKDLDENFDEKKAELIKNLQTLMKYIFRKENLTVSYTADETGYAPLEEKIAAFKENLYTDEVEPGSIVYDFEQKNEAYTEVGIDNDLKLVRSIKVVHNQPEAPEEEAEKTSAEDSSSVSDSQEPSETPAP